VYRHRAGKFLTKTKEALHAYSHNHTKQNDYTVQEFCDIFLTMHFIQKYICIPVSMVKSKPNQSTIQFILPL
jgi:hypothetical protein